MKRSKTIYTISALSLLIFIALTIFNPFNLGMFIFPYYAEIWGTISDWVMVFVTTLTAVYLIKTLGPKNPSRKWN